MKLLAIILSALVLVALGGVAGYELHRPAHHVTKTGAAKPHESAAQYRHARELRMGDLAMAWAQRSSSKKPDSMGMSDTYTITRVYYDYAPGWDIVKYVYVISSPPGTVPDSKSMYCARIPDAATEFWPSDNVVCPS